MAMSQQTARKVEVANSDNLLPDADDLAILDDVRVEKLEGLLGGLDARGKHGTLESENRVSEMKSQFSSLEVINSQKSRPCGWPHRARKAPCHPMRQTKPGVNSGPRFAW